MVSEFKKAFNNRADIAAEWKKSGNKVLGYFNALTPEELIYAAGILPVQLFTTHIPLTKTKTCLPDFICTHLKDCLEQAMTGTLDYLDGSVLAHACEASRGFYGVWKINSGIPHSHFLQIPATSKKASIDFFISELEIFKSFLETLSGNKITDESLINSIEVYNKNRSLMKKLYELRSFSDSTISGSNIIDVIKAGLVLPKDEHNRMLEKLISDYHESPDAEDDQGDIYICVVSNAIEEADTVIDVIEKCGGNVVMDNLSYGSRYCWENVESNSDPIESLATHYLEKIPFPGKFPMENIVDSLTDMAEESDADGMIWLVEKYCDPYMFSYPAVEIKAKEKGIRMMSIEAEEVGNLPRLQIKVEAFMESLMDEII
jgi:benzoyl-CoA reductase subunit C